MSILINIDPKSRRPIYRQIIDRVTELIESKAIKPGMRLPSTRMMADKLAVNRSTVYKAYQELFFRISIAHLDEQTIEKSIKRLAAGFDDLYD